MSDCGEVCSEHSGLETSIKWITKFLFLGFTAVLSAITYFNVTLSDTIAQMDMNVAALNYTIKDSVASLSNTIDAKSKEHNYSLENVVSRVDAVETFCFEDTK